VAARRIAASVTLGSHGRGAPGSAIASAVPPYSKDDTPQAIDWRQTGKFDTVYVREREWVAAQTRPCGAIHPHRCAIAPRQAAHQGRARGGDDVDHGGAAGDGGERIIRLAGDGKPQRAAAAGRLAVAQMADALAQNY